MFIIARKYGRLGNRLQLFAHFVAFAIENNQKIVNPAFLEYADLFQNTANDLFCRYPPKNSFIRTPLFRKLLYRVLRCIVYRQIIGKIQSKHLKIINAWPRDDTRKEFRLDDPRFLRSLRSRQIVLAEGYFFCDYVNLLRHADKIREYFRPLGVYDANISHLINKASESCDVLVGVHIRRGDYGTFRDGKLNYEIDDYVKVMEQMEKLFADKRVGFLVCSNETLDKNKFSKQSVTFGTNHMIEDMYSLARCDYLLGPFSTFNAWASFYGDVPLYWIENPNENISLDDFRSYEEIVHWHMSHAPQFPNFAAK